MPRRLSHQLAQLKVRGNKIVSAETEAPVLLRGVNVSGLEYCSPAGTGSLAKAGITPAVLDESLGNWNASVIRLPFNQNWALETEAYDPAAYRQAIETVVAFAAE